MTSRLNNDVVSDYCFISKLPFQILHEICFKLPIKDVMRCKTVCTEWNNLLSKPNFTEDYAKFSRFTSILYCIDRSTFGLDPLMLNLLEISEDGGDSIPSCIKLKLPRRFERSPSCLVGSCNGLACIQFHFTSSDVIYVTNPISGYGIELSRDYTIPKSCYIEDFKFGFSPSTNEFKVLKTAFRLTDCNTRECEIVTVGVDEKWRRLPTTFFTNLPMCSDFVALDGIFHWICNDKAPHFICTFDLGEEKFGQISFPSSLLLVSNLVHMAVFDKRLCLVDNSVPPQITIWTLQKDPVRESWTKIVLLNNGLPSEVLTHHLIPVAAVRRGDMLFECCAEFLVCYNVEQQRWSKIKFKSCARFPSLLLVGYTPSFSLPTERDQGLLLRADVIMKRRLRLPRTFRKIRLQ